MQLELSQPYKSIRNLQSEDLPDFTILIGRNGAGKSQLLQAINDGMVSIPNVSAEEIELYDMNSFRPPNSANANRHANDFGQSTSDAYLQSSLEEFSPIEIAADVFDQFARDFERNSGDRNFLDVLDDLRKEIEDTPDFTVFPSFGRDTGYKKALYEQVFAPLMPVPAGRQNRRTPNPPNNSFDGNQAVLVSMAMKLSRKLPHELGRDDIMRAPYYEGQTITNSLSQVFAAYKVDQFIWAHKRVERQHIRFDELIAEYRTRYQPPWEVLREILSSMRDAVGHEGLFNFDFSDPDGQELDLGNYEQFTFKAEMTNRTTRGRYELDSLSSGEKILMTLCLVSFNQYLGRRPPKLLLLDELDAVLHPSMVAALITTLKTLFVAKGTKVLMTSHSPMTVAALDETDIYRVSRTGVLVNVTQTNKVEAIDELSEGIATADMGLRIAAKDETKVTILTEGNNTRHLRRWVELMFQNDAYVLEGLEKFTNDSQLLAYGRLLGRMVTNTTFVVVWDCDAADKAEALRQELPSSARVIPFAFSRVPENSITHSGIENNYEDAILEPFSINKTDNKSGKLLARELPKERKNDFANHVLEEGKPEYFKHFQALYEIVSNILE